MQFYPPFARALSLVITLLLANASFADPDGNTEQLRVADRQAINNQLEARNWQEIDALRTLFADQNGQVTFVVYDREKKAYYGYNRERAETRYRPASTFKIVNSLIALETGVVNTQQIFAYDGTPKALKTWQKDMGLQEAMAVSNLPLYQYIARQIGQSRMQQYIRLFNYGNTQVANTDQTNNAFWVDGPIAISALEQIDFIEGILQHRWPISKQSYTKLQQIMPHEKGIKGELYFKTGLGNKPRPQIGWIVGWVLINDKTYPFALNMDINNATQIAQRIILARSALKQLDLY